MKVQENLEQYRYEHSSIFEELNRVGTAGTPVKFIINFKKSEAFICPLSSDISGLIVDFGQNIEPPKLNNPFQWKALPSPRKSYEKGFENALKELHFGNTFLLNLTYPTKVETNLTLQDFYTYAHAPYKVLLHNNFVSFSPESFVRIKNNEIHSFPMKGTIDASIPNAKSILLADQKEMAEHCTIVDLIRNDLSMVSNQVVVDRFRYLEKITSQQRSLWQASSHIKGQLDANWQTKLGEILDKLLPAGSISGAPKAKTLDIISDCELDDRHYYTGIAGIFDGEILESCVLIRYIEKQEDGLYYRSGGGITHQSELEKEFQEMKDKIYAPVF